MWYAFVSSIERKSLYIGYAALCLLIHDTNFSGILFTIFLLIVYLLGNFSSHHDYVFIFDVTSVCIFVSVRQCYTYILMTNYNNEISVKTTMEVSYQMTKFWIYIQQDLAKMFRMTTLPNIIQHWCVFLCSG